jgi:hypothetical protein
MAAPTTATLTPVKVGPNGTGKIADLVAAAAQQALVDGDAFACQGKEVLIVNNTDSGAHTVTIKAVADNFGLVSTSNDIVQAVAAGKVAVIGPFDPAKYADASGLCQIRYSAITGVLLDLLTFSVTS